MSALPLTLLVAMLAVLLLSAAFLSAADTALRSANRYRLLRRVRSGDRSARLAQRLLEHPEQLTSLFVFGKALLLIAASTIATLIALRVSGDLGALLAIGLLTLLVLAFHEGMAGTRSGDPERIALPAAMLLWPLHTLGGPLLRLVRGLVGELLRPFVRNRAARVTDGHRQMLQNILALPEARVEDIMVPRTEIRAIDLAAPAAELRRTLATFPFSRAVVCRDGLDNVVGLLNLRNVIDLKGGQALDAGLIEARMRKPYFVPEGTRLSQQLVEFQRLQRRSALVVDEYGELIGLVTLADILEEIVGDFTSEPKQCSRRIEPQADGSVLVDGRIALHSLNRRLGWDLPTDDANTLSGLIVSRLEALPQVGDRLAIDGFSMQLQQVRDHVIRMVRVEPPGGGADYDNG